jgi:hypothetical protein
MHHYRLACLPLLFTALALAGGCQPQWQTRTYDLSVKNDLSQPITIFLTKNGLPYERGWLGPEELAQNPISQDPVKPGLVIPPGQTGGNSHVVGHFAPSTSAVLRVYRKVGDIEDLAAISRGSPDRLDIFLHVGVNQFTITSDENGLSARKDEP